MNNRNRRTARAIALRAEDARQALLNRALLAIAGGTLAAIAGVAVAARAAGIAF